MAMYSGEFERVGNVDGFGQNLTLITGLGWNGTDLYALLGSFSPSVFVSLYTIDRTTGVATRVARNNALLNTNAGMAWDGTNMYVLIRQALHTINLTTGAVTRIGSATNYGVGESRARGLAWDGSNLYLVGGSTNALYILNRTTGRATRVGSADRFGIGGSFSASSLTWDDENLIMMGFDPSGLYTLNKTTGVATKIGTSTVNTNSIAWDGSDLFALLRRQLHKAVQVRPKPVFTAPTGQQVNEGTAWTLDLDTVFTNAASYDFQTGYAKPDYLSLVGSELQIATAPDVSVDTTIDILVVGINGNQRTNGTISLIIKATAAPPPPVVIPPDVIVPSTPIEDVEAFTVVVNDEDITGYVEIIRDVNASADYPEVNTYRIREATIQLIDPEGLFAPRNPNSMAKVGYPISIDVDKKTVFSGEIIETAQGVVEGSVLLICSGGSWKLGRDAITDFGVRRRFRVNQESQQQAAIALGRGLHRANGVYPVLPAALPASAGSTSGFGKALNDALIPVESLRTDGLLDYHRFIVDDQGVQTEGEPVPNPGAAFPQIIMKSPYRHQRALTLIGEILEAFGVENASLQIAPADIGQHFAQRGRVNYDLIGATGDRFDVPLGWGGFVTGFRTVGVDHYYLVSIARTDSLYESGIVKYDGHDDEYTLVHRFPRGTEIWDLAISANTFYVLTVSSTQPYYTTESGSDVAITQVDITTGATSVIANQGSTYPPIIANHIRAGFGRQGHYADNRSGFEVHKGVLYYRYKSGTTSGIARFPSPASVMSFVYDGNENDSNFAFSITGDMITGGVSWRDGTDSECEIFAVDIS